MDKIKEFIRKYRGEKFRHSEELFENLINGKCELSSYPRVGEIGLSCKHYLYIYEIRRDYLKQYGSQHSKSILEDIIELCIELEKTPEELVELWGFAMKPYYYFGVFVGSTSNRVLGCVLSIDQRLTGNNE